MVEPTIYVIDAFYILIIYLIYTLKKHCFRRFYFCIQYVYKTYTISIDKDTKRYI